MGENPSDHDAVSGWPDGWYVYENGKIDGPFSAAEAFKMEAETRDGKPRLVSRKGFSQWYALKDLSELFRRTESLGQRLARESEAAKGLSPKTPAKTRPAGDGWPSSLGSPPPAAAVTAVSQGGAAPDRRDGEAPPVSGKLNLRKVRKGTVQSRPAVSLAQPVADDSAPPVTMVPSTDEKVRQTAADAAFAAEAPPALSNTPKALEPTERKPAHAKRRAAKSLAVTAEVTQEYFISRGRLRLGKLRNPYLFGFLGLPLSLGLSWPHWIGELAREASFHARNVDKSPLPAAGLALIPFFHIYMIYRLALLVGEMESQNRYRSISPVVAALLALFPPLAVVYLQGAANRHWLLHVRHVMGRERLAS